MNKTLNYILLESERISNETLLKLSDIKQLKKIFVDKDKSRSEFNKFIQDMDFNDSVLIVENVKYFKFFTGVKKVDPTIGSLIPNKLFDNSYCIYIPSANNILLNSKDKQDEIIITSQILKFFNGEYSEIGNEIIKVEHYPVTVEQIRQTLERLKSFKTLTVDIETFSLRFINAGIATIAFGLDKHRGTAFSVDLKQSTEARIKIRQLLKEFFESYSGRLIYHNASFDVTVLIYQLFMKDINDYEGLLYGLEVMTKSYDDTKLIAYCYLNSCSKVSFSLKSLAQEFAGNYALEEINDVTKVPIKTLLRYNLIDCLSTYYLYEKYSLENIRNNEKDNVYDLILKPSLKVIIHTQLVGFPISKIKCENLYKELNDKSIELTNRILNNEDVKLYILQNKLIQLSNKYQDCLAKYNRAYNKRLEKYSIDHDKFMTKTMEKYLKESSQIEKDIAKYSVLDSKDIYNYLSLDDSAIFNDSSPDQLCSLLINNLRLPVLKQTDTGKPALGKSVLKDYLNLDLTESVKDLIQCLFSKKELTKIISSFVIPWLDLLVKTDMGEVLFGNFNLGATVSGRLSSAQPNL